MQDLRKKKQRNNTMNSWTYPSPIFVPLLERQQAMDRTFFATPVISTISTLYSYLLLSTLSLSTLASLLSLYSCLSTLLSLSTLASLFSFFLFFLSLYSLHSGTENVCMFHFFRRRALLSLLWLHSPKNLFFR